MAMPLYEMTVTAETSIIQIIDSGYLLDVKQTDESLGRELNVNILEWFQELENICSDETPLVFAREDFAK